LCVSETTTRSPTEKASEMRHEHRRQHAPADHRESVHVRHVDEEESVAHLCGRELFDQTLADAAEEARGLVVVDDAIVALRLFGDDVAQIHLLLRREHALRARGGGDDGLLTGLL
jgi:hypothetical protein